jgi:hypothetical protein
VLTQRQALLAPGVVLVAAQNADQAMTAAAQLHVAGVPSHAMLAAPAGMTSLELATALTPLARRHHHVVVIAVTPPVALARQAVHIARSLGRAGTLLAAGSAEFTTAWGHLVDDGHVPADQVIPAGTPVLLYDHGIDLSAYTGTFAVIGDVHGCQATLAGRLLPALGWHEQTASARLTAGASQNDRPLLVSVGDVHDKGVDSVAALRFWLGQMRSGAAVMADSNHARALVKALRRPDLPVRDCVAATVAENDAAPDREQLR